MGYTTDFIGTFTLDKPLTPEHKTYIEKFSGSRRMQRDEYTTERMDDPYRIAVGLPIGSDSAYFVGGFGWFGDEEDGSIKDYNIPPRGQPGLWCHWVPTKDGMGIEWDGGEKFYRYIDWLKYIIQHFLKPWGYVLNGKVNWEGEDRNDVGTIVVKDNTVTTE